MLRDQHGVFDLGLFQVHAHIHTGQQHAVWVRYFGAHRDLARGWIHRQVRKQQTARMGVLFAVFGIDANLGRILAIAGQLACCKCFAHLQNIGRRLRDVDVQRMHLLDNRKLGRIALAHQCAFSDQ